ncbi:MAG TPA: CRISPR-associated helicase Cas3' [Pseudonocardiaceae bacterium]|jgi:CRISPR-associated helicase Cas3/CRISPR-associated endonuclease Cas3-HD|nr:CRISPR-associated helicase Cas3' [Pseudonocardiaceae bacterium]
MSGEFTALSAWAKSLCNDHGELTHWLPLHQHLDDTAGIAGELVDHWVSPQVLARIAIDLPDGLAGVRRIAHWLAAVHDVGKASPAFAVQVKQLADRMHKYGLIASPALARDPQRSRVNHALVGHVTVQDWLVSEHNFPRRTIAAQLAGVVGSHHGVTPEGVQLTLVRERPDLTGTGTWEHARVTHLERATAGVGGPDVLRTYRDVVLSKPSQVLLTAIVIVADWIASNPHHLPLYPISETDRPPETPDASRTAHRVARGWKRLDLPPRWAAQALGTDVDQVFRDRFDRPDDQPRPVQRAAVEVAAAQAGPGLVVIEAPMGAGKTEAALLAAEVLAHASGADGCFVALPSQATSDAMFDRVLRWLDVLPGRVDGADVTVNLAHGKAHLNDTYAGLVSDGQFTAIGETDEGALIAHQWLSGRKKAVLASFVVGTIDQVLFAGLKSRHLMLRHLALAGKVVIIDEVHAYDVYMSQYLDRVLHWLGAYRVPVVLLSATLPVARRGELLRAYDSGAQTPTSAGTDHDPGYPVVLSSGNRPPHPVEFSPERTTVHLDHLADDLDALVDHLRAHLVEGGCAVVVRNTVARVQETADRLADEFGIDQVTVNHSRFLSCDRARIDRQLLRQFGPPGTDTARPPLHIVVASQVVEQSLDVDFDLLVTDLAPVDLVLQRMGRLHRHRRDRPTPVTQARCALVGVEDWSGTPVTAVRGSRRVYGEHPLLRSAALLTDRTSITLPTEIAPLVQRAYDEHRLGPASWQDLMESARVAAEHRSRARQERARDFLLGETTPNNRGLVGWLHAGVGDADDDHRGLAQVRDGEETLEVLVVQRDADGGLLTPAWIERGAGQQIPLDLAVEPEQARVIASCSLRLPLALTHPGVIDDVIATLEANQFSSFGQSPTLAGQLVLVLDADRTALLHHGAANFRLTYDPHRGLTHEHG